MAIKYKSARQEQLTAILDISYADIDAYGVAENAIEVPDNAILTGGGITVVTPWNSGGAATFALGDAAVANRYASAVDLKVAARTSFTLTGYKHTVTEFLKALMASAGAAPTAGQARLVLHYVRQGRVCTAQGLDYRGVGVPGA